MTPLLQLKNITKEYRGVPAISDVSIELDAGRVHARGSMTSMTRVVHVSPVPRVARTWHGRLGPCRVALTWSLVLALSRRRTSPDEEEDGALMKFDLPRRKEAKLIEEARSQRHGPKTLRLRS
mgnify:CR=1 FL=1